MATVTVKEENPLVGAKRKKIMEAVNDLSPTAVANLETLLNSQKAMGYLSNNIKFLGLKAFI